MGGVKSNINISTCMVINLWRKGTKKYPYMQEKPKKIYVLLHFFYVLLHFKAILTRKRQLFHIGVKIDTS